MSVLHQQLRSKLAEAVVARGWSKVEMREPNTLEVKTMACAGPAPSFPSRRR